MSSRLRAEFYFDREAGNWHFRVPALHIVGGGADTRDAVERQCLEAVAFALEGDPDEYDDESDAVELEVTISAA
jgi:hypothetical protein